MIIDCKNMGKLINYISEVAITLRMNSSYCASSLRNDNTPVNVMWLSDMLHNLTGIGNAIQSEDKEILNIAIDKQVTYWLRHTTEIEQARLNSIIVGTWSVQEGIGILNDIRNANNDPI